MSIKFDINIHVTLAENNIRALQSIVSVRVRGNINEIDIVSTDDKTVIQHVARKTMRPAMESTLNNLVVKQSRRKPEAEAIHAWDGSFTYRQIEYLSRALAQNLMKQGRFRDVSYVIFCIEKSRWAIIAMLAILRSGYAYVPLDPLHPHDRLQNIVSQTNAKWILVSVQTKERYQRLGTDLYCIDTISLETHNNDAYVMFTSGSIGQPNGVVVQHGASCTSIEQQVKCMRLKPDSRVLQYTSFVFDISLCEIFSGHRVGACIWVPSDTDRIEQLRKLMNEFRISWAQLTPSISSMILPAQVQTLNTIVVAGEAVVAEVIRTWGSATDLVIGYGPTKTTVYCTVHYPKTEDKASVTGTVVTFLCYVVESANSDKLVPIGGVGELLISCPLLSRGYLGASDHTSTFFIIGPSWSDDKMRRFFCTEDLLRFLPDGNLSFLGRKDNQVKLRDYRIELSKIEAAIPHLSAVLLPRRGLLRDKIVALIPISRRISTVELKDNH
ncbi:unnamed protein product [Fusarium venenatum]|uniref:AMP-dependent synthetase/ligase domain-containing protein n=1 Tax=Fusarium venenatum TaxID=56646 RepID=A0A2L2TD45_9HYPO|nr:uncharacterized protein FVRRES_07956 [Fusarium venenatum]CEI67879.1 unnamed protein product [Fusarium venenatum]